MFLTVIFYFYVFQDLGLWFTNVALWTEGTLGLRAFQRSCRFLCWGVNNTSALRFISVELGLVDLESMKVSICLHFLRCKRKSPTFLLPSHVSWCQSAVSAVSCPLELFIFKLGYFVSFAALCNPTNSYVGADGLSRGPGEVWLMEKRCCRSSCWGHRSWCGSAGGTMVSPTLCQERLSLHHLMEKWVKASVF